MDVYTTGSANVASGAFAGCSLLTDKTIESPDKHAADDSFDDNSSGGEKKSHKKVHHIKMMMMINQMPKLQEILKSNLFILVHHQTLL